MTALGKYTHLGITLLRTGILGSAFAALLAGSIGDARANQSGPDVNATNQQRICRFFGGDVAPEDVWADRTNGGGLISTGTACKGGLLDGLNCINDKYGAMCWFALVRVEEESHVAPTAGVEVLEGSTARPTTEPAVVDVVTTQDEPVDEVVTGDETVTGDEPTVAEEPVAEEPSVAEESGTPPTTVETVEPGTVEEPAIDTAPVDRSWSFPPTADDGDDIGA